MCGSVGCGSGSGVLWVIVFVGGGFFVLVLVVVVCVVFVGYVGDVVDVGLGSVGFVDCVLVVLGLCY